MSISDWKVGGGIVHRFHGNPKCNQCSEFSGLYDEDPDDRRPHPDCDCRITTEFIAGVYQEGVLKNKSVTDSNVYEVEGTGYHEWVNDTNTVESHTMSVTETFEVNVGLSQEVEDNFTASGSMKGTLSVTDSVTKQVQPGETIVVQVMATVVVKKFSADRYFVFKDGTEVNDGKLEEEGETLEGSRMVTSVG